MFDDNAFDMQAFSAEAFMFLTIIAYSIRRMFEVGIERRQYFAGL